MTLEGLNCGRPKAMGRRLYPRTESTTHIAATLVAQHLANAAQHLGGQQRMVLGWAAGGMTQGWG